MFKNKISSKNCHTIQETSQKFVDLFCGGGFGACDAVKAGAQPILAVDAWDLATETYKANFPGAHVITKKLIHLVSLLTINRTYSDIPGMYTSFHRQRCTP